MSALILVVDDEPDVAELFRQQFRRELRAAQFKMEFAQSAPEALERVDAAEKPDLILILSDVNMPGMSGLELLPRARKAIEAGAAGLFTKPIDFPELRDEIGRRLEAAMGSA
jgi:CheY-like chemotaxis protein